MTPARIAIAGSIFSFAAMGYLIWSTRTPAEAPIIGEALGTTYRVVTNGRRGELAKMTVSASIDTALGLVDRTFSTWRDDSQIARFNAYEGTDWFEVSLPCVELVEQARRISEQTDGAFDITVGPLVELWGFGRAGRTEPPTDGQVESARKLVGYQRIETRRDPPAMRKSDAAMRLDLSAIAKGDAADLLANVIMPLSESDVAELVGVGPLRGVMVEIGGEVRVRGEGRAGGPWVIGIEAPTPESRSVMHRVALADQAMATSGDYRNFVERDGKRLGHIIDPRTGRPVAHDLASASVIADTCAEADALATALMVMGPTEARAFAEKQGLAVMLIERTAEGAGFTTWTSAAWPK